MTQRVGLEQRLSGEIARELASRGRFKVQATADGADAVLTGAVVGFNLFPVAFDSQGRATDYQVQITTRASLKTLPEEKVLWENPAFTFRDNYQFNATRRDLRRPGERRHRPRRRPVRAEPRDEHAGGVLAVARASLGGLRLRRTGLRLARMRARPQA